MLKPETQAASLERPAPPTHKASDLPLCIAVASGKGGVGKTFVCVNLALAFRRFGRRVLIVDADLGLANVDIQLGLQPTSSLQDALFQGRPLAEVVVSSPWGVDLLAASPGCRAMVNLGENRLSLLINDLLSLARSYDVILFDCASGVTPSVMNFLAAAPRQLVVATSQPTSVMDVYVLAKMLAEHGPRQPLDLIVNQVESQDEGIAVHRMLTRVVGQFLQCPVRLQAIIPASHQVKRSIARGEPLVHFDERDDAAAAIVRLARDLLAQSWHEAPAGLETLAQTLLDHATAPAAGMEATA